MGVMNQSSEQHARGGAIVGMAGRFPGASTIDEFWSNLTNGVESVKFSSEEELAAAGVDAATLANRNFIRASSTIREPEFFDAAFFGYSAREAEIIDPQQRVFLECAWEALEDAACDPDTFAGAIAVFAGAGMNTYAVTNLFSRPDVVASAGAYQIMVANDKDFLATRVAYKLNLRGPAIGVQTACSTSLVAVQMAFESLLRGECDLALAGGVSIPVPQSPGYMYVPGMILSRDGHCRAFDASASGTVPGSGAGVVVLKRLDDALDDGDHIYAVIQGAAINNDGSAKVGYSAPSVEGQSAVIRRSMEMAGFESGSIAYVEAHGTGTEVGDPIEFTALAEVFGSATAGSQSCALGSVKTNIGHLDTASGVAGLIKAALAIKHREIPPTLHFAKPNPLIDFSVTPFHVNTISLPVEEKMPFRVGVSSFGIGGTNAHVSLAEGPRVESDASSGAQLIVLSAKSTAALEERFSQLQSFLDVNPSTSLADLAFTLQVGRKSFRHRQAIAASNIAELSAALQSRTAASSKLLALKAEAPMAEATNVAFMFPGQGSQYVNMGLALYRGEAVFRETVDRCCELLKEHLQLDLRTILYPEPGSESDSQELLGQTSMTQPALFTIEYAMAKLWLSCGVHPTAMLGHSVGEYIAACIAGVFSLEDALALVAERGRLIQSLPSGAMLAVGLSEQDLEPLLSPELSIAAINSSNQTVASGNEDAVAALEAALLRRKIECKRLRTSHAFHSPMMEPILAEFTQAVSKIELKAPSIRFVSNVTGTWITTEEAVDPAYWASHLRSTVRFADCARTLASEADSVLLEVGPGETLSALVRGKSGQTEVQLLTSMRHPLAQDDDREFWLTAVARLWLQGAPIKWEGLHTGSRRLKLSLPTYPFQRQRHYIEAGKAIEPAKTALDRQVDIANWFYAPSWKRSVDDLLAQTKPTQLQTWLVLCEDGTLMDALSTGLTASGRVIQVRPSESFDRISDERYAINPASREDYVLLLDDLRSRSIWPGYVVHAFAASFGPDTCTKRAADLSVYSALALIQAMEERLPRQQVEFNVLCNRAYSLLGESISSVAAEALNAFTKVVPTECQNIRTRVIDVDLTEDLARAAGQVVGELCSMANDQTVAYRGNARWLQTYEPVLLPAPRANTGIAIRAGGTYIITGGTGGIGLVLALHLARKSKVRLILTSRTSLPSSSQWPELVGATDTSAELREKISVFTEIEAVGGEIIFVEVDTADSEAMLQLVAKMQSQYGAINGVIHAAGTAGAGMIQTMSREQVLATLASKVDGSEWIRKSLGAPELDFVLLCSSISAVVPAFGLSVYAASNAYLDAFANMYDDPASTRVISVGWDTWREVGMAANAPLPQGLEELREESLRHGMLSSEATEVLDRILCYPRPHVIVSTRPLNALLQVVGKSVSESRAAVAVDEDGRSRPEAIAELVATGDELEQFVIRTWQELLGVKTIGLEDNFFQLGGHSLLGTQVLARIYERFGVNLTLRTIFEATTPAQLAQSVRFSTWSVNDEVSHPDLEREEIEL